MCCIFLFLRLSRLYKLKYSYQQSAGAHFSNIPPHCGDKSFTAVSISRLTIVSSGRGETESHS